MSKKVYIPILIVIIILQILVGVYAANKKEYMHMDEAYSYGLMNYDKISITDDEDFMAGWHDKQYFLDYLEVNSDEVTDLMPVYENQKNDVHPPLFYLLLRIAATFTVDNFTLWTGFIMNMIILAIASVTLFFIAKKLFKSPVYALLVTAVYATSMALMETTIYIRMYALSTLSILLFTYITMKIEKNQKDGKIGLKYLIPTSLVLLMGGLTHYYFFIYVFGVYVYLLIKHIRRKEYKFLVKYTVTLAISAIIYLLIFPYAINHIFFGYRGIDATEPVTLQSLIQGIKQYYREINKAVFNYGLPIYAIAVLVIFAVFKIREKRVRAKKCNDVKSENQELKQEENAIKAEKIRGVAQKNNQDEKITEKNNSKTEIKEKKNRNPFILMILIPTIIYFVVVLIQSPYKELRYIMPICPEIVLLTIYVTKLLLGKYIKEKYLCTGLAVVFAVIVLTPGLTDNKLNFAYEYRKELVETVEKNNTPIVCVFDPNANRFMDNMYLYTKADRTYIMNVEDYSVEAVREVLKDENVENGVTLVIDNQPKYLNGI